MKSIEAFVKDAMIELVNALVHAADGDVNSTDQCLEHVESIVSDARTFITEEDDDDQGTG